MNYVEALLRYQLDLHRKEFTRFKAEGNIEDIFEYNRIIVEIEFVLQMLINSNIYQDL